MSDHQVRSPLRPVGEFDSPSRATAVTAASGAFSEFVVDIRRDEMRLTEYELSEFRRWLRNCWSGESPSLLALGCSANTSREDRRCRLRELVEQVELCGPTRDVILYSDAREAPPSQRSAAAFEQEVLWVNVLPAGSAAPKSVGARRVRPVAACT